MGVVTSSAVSDDDGQQCRRDSDDVGLVVFDWPELVVLAMQGLRLGRAKPFTCAVQGPHQSSQNGIQKKLLTGSTYMV
jgi:hypothetical protein